MRRRCPADGKSFAGGSLVGIAAGFRVFVLSVDAGLTDALLGLGNWTMYLLIMRRTISSSILNDKDG